MFVTNLTSGKLGIDGLIQLMPNEENRFLEDTPDLVARVNRLKRANLVSVRFEEGLVKPEPAPAPVVAPVEPVSVEAPSDAPAPAVEAPAPTKATKEKAKKNA